MNGWWPDIFGIRLERRHRNQITNIPILVDQRFQACHVRFPSLNLVPGWFSRAGYQLKGPLATLHHDRTEKLPTEPPSSNPMALSCGAAGKSHAKAQWQHCGSCCRHRLGTLGDRSRVSAPRARPVEKKNTHLMMFLRYFRFPSSVVMIGHWSETPAFAS